MTELELKPCPFCGGEPTPIMLGLVCCENCGATIDIELWNDRVERTCHDLETIGGLFVCSACGEVETEGTHPDYCPSCGAKVVD